MKQHFYHYGLTIKKYRELRGWTQAKLAQNWLRSDRERGVNTRYVQDIEYGTKRIDDPDVLRDLSTLLDIPLWEFGLSEYNPFDPSQLPGRGKSMYDETLNVTEALIKQTLSLRRIAGGDVYKLSRSLGHSEIGTTEEYLKDFKSRDARKDHDHYSPVIRLKQANKQRSKKSDGLFE